MLKEKQVWRNLELRIAYCGSEYFGWQKQPHKKTVQDILIQSLSRVLGSAPVRLQASSRTDTGVHAHDQHVNFHTQNPIPVYNIQRSLNHHLPESIRVRSVREAPMLFSARHHSCGKHYGYILYNHKQLSPFTAPYVWHFKRLLDSDAMAEAARAFVGTRCFRGLQDSDDHRLTSETTIYDVRLRRRRHLVMFEVVGCYFLYHMVRNMIGSLVQVGLGEWTPEEMVRRLNVGRRAEMGRTAPAQGLHLFEVFYDPPPLTFSERADGFLNFLDCETGF